MGVLLPRVKEPFINQLEVLNEKVITKHQELVIIASKWLKHHKRNIEVPNCPYIISEFVTNTITNETPDVLGWCYWTSILIEVKVSRGDFLADTKKPFRQSSETGVGEFRYYFCPQGLIKENELPEYWGLLYLNDTNKIDIIKGAIRQTANLTCERTMLLSLIRRMKRN